jgi:hypothetical protein
MHSLINLLVLSELAQVVSMGVIDQLALSDEDHIEASIDNNDEKED